MKNSAVAVREVASRFRYIGDERQYGKREKWKIMRAEEGPLEGDCEDFALTVLWNIADKSMWKFWWLVCTFQAMIWFTKTERGNGHAMLWYRGRWVDNIYSTWSDKPRHPRYFPYVAPLMALKMLIAR